MSDPFDDWAEDSARVIGRAIARVASERGSVRLALAGGSTPAPVYARLARVGSVPWDRVRVYFGDERCVPRDHPASNYRMARETLLTPAGVADDRVHPMWMDGEGSPAGAAAAYARILPERLDVLLLGIGADGHTASLFPDSPALQERRRTVVSVRAPVPPAERLTVTPPVIEAARALFVLARGREKSAAVRRALEGDWAPRACPAQLARRATWLVDAAASSRLSEDPNATA